MSNVLLCHICTYCSAFKASTWKARRSNQSILKEINPEYSLEGLMLKMKLQYFGHLMWRTGKDPAAGKDWRREEKGVTEDVMFGWHHWLKGHEFEQILGESEGQGSLECCSQRGRKESDMTEQLSNSKLYFRKCGAGKCEDRRNLHGDRIWKAVLEMM